MVPRNSRAKNRQHFTGAYVQIKASRTEIRGVVPLPLSKKKKNFPRAPELQSGRVAPGPRPTCPVGVSVLTTRYTAFRQKSARTKKYVRKSAKISQTYLLPGISTIQPTPPVYWWMVRVPSKISCVAWSLTECILSQVGTCSCLKND